MSCRPAALILGCAGPKLTDDERRFFADADPLGFILFARNVESRDQLARLSADLRAAVGRGDAPILIDQEGGRVARLRPPQWRDLPPAAAIGALYVDDADAGLRAARATGFLIGLDCAEIGVSVACAPVLDLRVDGADPIVGDRSYGATPDVVVACGRAMAEGLGAAGVLPVVKHIPGHGRATADSHEALPIVDAPLADLDVDFAPFRAFNDAPIGMTAHIRYDALDPDRPLTTSPRAIAQAVRGAIGFDGLLLSDDLCMKALDGDMRDRAAQALAAGCDVALHCDGALDGGRAAADGAAPMNDAAWRRWTNAGRWPKRDGADDAARTAADLARALDGRWRPA